MHVIFAQLRSLSKAAAESDVHEVRSTRFIRDRCLRSTSNNNIASAHKVLAQSSALNWNPSDNQSRRFEANLTQR